MIKYDRVEQMIKMTMFDKKHSQELKIAMEYRKQDYISTMKIIAFSVGTLIFLIIYLSFIAAIIYVTKINIHASTIFIFIFLGILIYSLFMFFHLKMTEKNADIVYKKMSALTGDYSAVTVYFAGCGQEYMLLEEFLIMTHHNAFDVFVFYFFFFK